MRQIFLDTETTGLSADKGDRVIEIGCVEFVNRKATGEIRHYYLNAGRDSHEDALKVHGLTREFLKDKPTFEEVAGDLLHYLQGAELLIHNAPFDLGFLNQELALIGQPAFASHVLRIVDTLAMAKDLYPGKRNSLDGLCDRLGVDRSGRKLHGALLDAELLADVYINMTRRQDALLIDAPAEENRCATWVGADLSSYELSVPAASEQELSAHEEVLKQIDKASAGKTVWRLLA